MKRFFYAYVVNTSEAQTCETNLLHKPEILLSKLQTVETEIFYYLSFLFTSKDRFTGLSIFHKSGGH